MKARISTDTNLHKAASIVVQHKTVKNLIVATHTIYAVTTQEEYTIQLPV